MDGCPPDWACAAWERAALPPLRLRQIVVIKKACLRTSLFQKTISMPHTLVCPLESKGRFVGPTRKPIKVKIQVSHKTYSEVNTVSPARFFPSGVDRMQAGFACHPWVASSRLQRSPLSFGSQTADCLLEALTLRTRAAVNARR